MRRILLSLLVIISVAGATIQLSSAFFSDTETSANNTFTAGTIDLKVNGEDNPLAIVNFKNLLPGGKHDEDKELRVIDHDAYVWMHIKDVQTGPGGDPTQPEADEEAGLGGPKDNINDYMKYSFALNSNAFFNEPINFNDAVSCWIPLGTFTGGQTVNMVQSFHLDEGVTNWAQGDTMSFTEEFYAEQFDNNPNPAGPVSLTGRVWNSQQNRCEWGNTVGNYTLTLTCTAGCANTNYVHNMSIANHTDNNFSGTGGATFSSQTWVVNGNISGNDVNMNIDYNSSSYFVDLIGQINSATNWSGTGSSSTGQQFSWVLNKN